MKPWAPTGGQYGLLLLTAFCLGLGAYKWAAAACGILCITLIVDFFLFRRHK